MTDLCDKIKIIAGTIKTYNLDGNDTNAEVHLEALDPVKIKKIIRLLKLNHNFIEEQVNSAQAVTDSIGVLGQVGSIAWNNQMKGLIPRLLIKDIATEFYYHWHNSEGANTTQGFDDWWEVNQKRFVK